MARGNNKVRFRQNLKRIPSAFGGDTVDLLNDIGRLGDFSPQTGQALPDGRRNDTLGGMVKWFSSDYSKIFEG
jgi:hypothetical protein